MKRFIIISVILVLLDQLTKILFTGKHYEWLIFAINYSENTGMAFGFLQNSVYLLAILSIIVIIAIIYYYKQLQYKLVWIVLFAGALGNAIDRIFLGHVRDFIVIYIWPTFNLADMYTTIAVLILIYLIFIDKKLFKVTRT
ncbi:MAG: signal peptidase II [archaeon]